MGGWGPAILCFRTPFLFTFPQSTLAKFTESRHWPPSQTEELGTLGFEPASSQTRDPESSAPSHSARTARGIQYGSLPHIPDSTAALIIWCKFCACCLGDIWAWEAKSHMQVRCLLKKSVATLQPLKTFWRASYIYQKRIFGNWDSLGTMNYIKSKVSRFIILRPVFSSIKFSCCMFCLKHQMFYWEIIPFLSKYLLGIIKTYCQRKLFFDYGCLPSHLRRNTVNQKREVKLRIIWISVYFQTVLGNEP